MSVADLVGRLADAGESSEDLGIDLAGIGLPGDGIDGVEPELGRDPLLEFRRLSRDRRRRAGGTSPACRWFP